MENISNIMSISFGISGDKLLPNEITNLLKITPTKAWKKGDTYKSKYRNKNGSFEFRELKRPAGIWELSSLEEVLSNKLEDHASFIIQKLESSMNQIDKILSQSSMRTSINIWWQPEDGYGGYTLSADTIRKLSLLCNEMDFYFS